ncbi:MAG: hypothetical protein JWP52_3698 [Rhizobacter sp.]|nr:hypothetical protein [Rhizobacter sp.]
MNRVKRFTHVPARAPFEPHPHESRGTWTRPIRPGDTSAVVRSTRRVWPALQTPVRTEAVESIQAAGHHDTVFDLGHGVSAKLARPPEVRSLERLQSLLPTAVCRIKSLADLAPEDRVRVAGLQAMRPDREVLLMETVGGNIPMHRRWTFDVKTDATASVRELRNGGCPAALRKKARASIGALFNGARGFPGRGYALEGLVKQGQSAAAESGLGVLAKFALACASDEHLGGLLELPQAQRSANLTRLAERLHTMVKELRGVRHTSVSSSVLMVIDTDDATHTDVKLIDFEHPIGADEPHAAKYQARLVGSVEKLAARIDGLRAQSIALDSQARSPTYSLPYSYTSASGSVASSS